MNFIEIIVSIGMVLCVSMIVIDNTLYSDSLFERMVWGFVLIGLLVCLVSYIIKVV